MQKTKRKKILLYTSLIILLVAVFAYIFRYPLILQFQYSRLRSLTCHEKSGTAKVSCLQRLWAHRVNSVRRYDILENKFEGFESDIVYIDSLQSFLVYHPPLQAGDTLTLDYFFQQVDLQHKHFWLDTRFIDSSNMHRALAALTRLNEKYPVQQNCILEVYLMQAAVLFSQNGYTVSFNVSDPLLHRLTGNKPLQDSVDRELAAVRYVSQDAQYVPALKEFFPKKQIITWHVFINDFFDTAPLQQLLDDPRIDIILVNIKSRFYH